MAPRLRAWVLVTPLAAAGIFGAHALSYRLTGAEDGAVHEYLGHVPQVLAVLVSIGVVGLAVQERSLGKAPLWPFVLVGPLGFACQEHVERLVHTGEVPWLLTSPTFLLGIALQLPVAVLCVALVRRVLGTLTGVRRRRPAVPGERWLPLSASAPLVPRIVHRPRPMGRGPPALRVF